MIHTLLDQYFPWYRQVSPPEQEALQQRVQLLIKGRQFKERGELTLTNAHKVLIGAAAAWVTRGVDKFYFPHFNLITVYPDHYFARIEKRYQKDRIHLPGAIVVAWRNLEQEYTNQPLPFQTLFHEWSHAVYFENVMEGEGYADIDPVVLEQLQRDYWQQVTQRLPEEGAFLNEPTAAHAQQFFAGASEWFFTDPKTIARKAEALYTWLQHVYQLS